MLLSWLIIFLMLKCDLNVLIVDVCIGFVFDSVVLRLESLRFVVLWMWWM